MYNGNFRGAIMIHRSYFGKVFVLKTHHWNAQIQEARNKPLLHALCHDWLYHVIVELSQYLFAPSGGILIAESNNVLLEEIEVSVWYTRYGHLNHLPTYSHMGDPSIIYNQKKHWQFGTSMALMAEKLLEVICCPERNVFVFLMSSPEPPSAFEVDRTPERTLQ